MALVVADTGPLHYLILVDEATLLPRLFGRVLIPAGYVTNFSIPGHR